MTHFFERISARVASAAGQPHAFILASLTIIIWGLTGPLFRWSDTWQLVINTGTTIVTFLMVFLIQNAQNWDGSAIQAKLDELIRAGGKARNEFIGIEHLTDNQIERIRSALEEEALAAVGHVSAADQIVDRLLERH